MSRRKWREPSATLVVLYRVGYTADGLSGKLPNLTLHRWSEGGRVCDGWDERDGIVRSSSGIVGHLGDSDFCTACLLKKPGQYHDDIAAVCGLTTDETLDWITGGKRK